MSVFRVILVRIFPHSDWIRGDTKYLFILSPSAGKCGPKYLWIQIYFPAFGLNTGRYEVSLHIQSECRKMRAKISPNTDIFSRIRTEYGDLLIYSLYLSSIYNSSNIYWDTKYLFVFSPNAGKCGPEYLRIQTLFTQWF